MAKVNFRQMVNQLDMHWRRSVPVVHQTESSECGLACLSMICGHYGKNIDLISLRRQFNLSARGTSLSGIKGMAEELGMLTRALSLELHELGGLQVPCILHWNFNHFVVLV
ncbi:colicin V synthesis protein, partial [Salmonella enterica]|nr:colicin V synthesis protein [Salmonella enterica]